MLCVPKVFIEPPFEDHFNETCQLLSFNDKVHGLSNPLNNDLISFLNASIQFLSSIDYIEQELPISSKNNLTNNLVDSLMSMESSTINWEWLFDAFPPFILHNETNYHQDNNHNNEIFLKNLEISNQTPFINQYENCMIPYLDLMNFFQYCLSHSLFGKRFTFSYENLMKKHSSFYLDLTIVKDRETVSLISLFNKSLGIQHTPFFFGGQKPVDFMINCQTMFNITKFSKLPDLLMFSFNRTIMNSNELCTLSIEMPRELNLDHVHSTNQKSFYRIHAFITQTKGHFLVYTRKKLQPQHWYKCDDDKISLVVLEGSISSKGVVFVVYKLA